jgi:hypothetical protein
MQDIPRRSAESLKWEDAAKIYGRDQLLLVECAQDTSKLFGYPGKASAVQPND